MNRPLPFQLTAIALALLGSGALAQQAPAGAAPAAAERDPKEEVQVITVTAQKRSQTLKEVPLAVSVVDNEKLEKSGVRDIYDLAKVAPSLDFGDPGTGGAGGSASIRGIGTAVRATSAESSVGVVVDGVPLGNIAGNALFDVERVEVLRGPQGTLFGKSASAGVLNLTSKAPRLGRTEGFVTLEASGGEVTNLALRGAYNLPIDEQSALRITAHAGRMTGVVENVLLDEKSETNSEGLRLRYLLKPNNDLSINLIAEQDTSTNKHVAFFFAPKVAYGTALSDFEACGVTVSPDNNQVCGDTDDYKRVKVSGLSGQVDWTMPGGLTLTSITALRNLKQDQPQIAIDMNNTYGKVRGGDDRDLQQLSQELRLASPNNSTVEWTAGYFHSEYESDKYEPATLNPIPPLTIERTTTTRTRTRSDALFGQAAIKLGDQDRLIVGLRQTQDKVSEDASRTEVINGGVPLATQTTGSVSLSNTSGKLGWQHAFDAQTNGYVTLTRGYKAPQIDNVTALRTGAPTGQVVAAEIPTNLEIGLKTSLLNRKVDLDVALFRNRVKNFQEQVCELAPVGALDCTSINVPTVTSQGVEVELRARPFAGLTVNAAGTAVLGTEFPSGYISDGNDVGGQRLLYTAKGKLVLGAEYYTSVFNDWGWSIGGDVSYKTAVRYCNSLTPECTYKAHAIVDLRTSLSHPDDNFEVTLFVRNATDERVPNAIVYPLPGKGNDSGYAHLLGPNSFRSVGVSASYRF